MLEEPYNDEEISFVEQSVFDRFIQASKHLRSQYNMQLSIHDAIILDALLRHYTVRAAAQELRITPHTLSNYQHTLLKRFNCQNRQELRIYCQKRGWSTPIIAVAARTSVKHLPDTTDY
jgi:DNA-binding NarL/FixJ family response regulator